MVTNTQLIDACRRGDANAWQQLVYRYAPLVRSVALRYGFSAFEADDICQEVLLALAQGLHQLEDPERLSGWLFTAARRTSWRALQRRRTEPVSLDSVEDTPLMAQTTPLHEPAPTVNELLDEWQRQELIQLGLLQLAERCRTLLTLLFLDPNEPSYDEISTSMKMPRGSIGPTRNRCLQQLRLIFETMGYHEHA
ncbi:MAG: sigma-70 family RNA polymerase sigma factor [Caldilineaceae bacterium]|nr:sigma-70 family RNA polymerase sigma factor [Caldilineaceae bacterium]